MKKNLTETNIYNEENKVRPYKEAMYASVFYLIFGLIWIFFSDLILNALIDDPEKIKKIQLAKGWIFVLLTGLIIYSITLYRMKLLESATNRLYDSYSSLVTLSQKIKNKDHQIHELSHYDPMTGLLNWQGLSIAFENMIKEKGEVALCYLDIDNIKHINETLGHENGNLLLKKISEKLKTFYDTKGIISRVSGDEFLILMPCDKDKNIEELALEIVNVAKTDWKEGNLELLVTSSLGVAVYPKHGNSFDDLMRHSDLAMYIAKGKGKNCFSIYNEIMGDEKKTYVQVISQIRKGIENKEFVLYYQPIINLSTKTLVAVEALIRWEHPIRGFLSPFHFIDIAEKSGQINQLGQWVFEEACQQLKQWGNEISDLKMSINLSGKRLFDKDLILKMKKVLLDLDLKPENVQIEITETAVMDNVEEAINLLNEMRDLGMVIALDDFGTGYSSLTHLQIFPIEVLKIDKDFISKLSDKGIGKEKNIINAIIELGHSLNLKIVAEGIESHEQSEYLIENGCDYGQGYYYDRPMKADDIEKKYFKDKTRI